MDWNFTSDRPIYIQIVEQVERGIVAGAYPPGERLPSVRDLALEAQVNPNTMQKALSELETRGLVAVQRTSGRVITADEARIFTLREKLSDDAARRYFAEMETLGYDHARALEHLKGSE